MRFSTEMNTLKSTTIQIMKSIITRFAIALFIISCSSPKEKDDLLVVNQRAEFEAQEAIWLIWPSTDHKEGESVENVTLAIIEALIDVHSHSGNVQEQRPTKRSKGIIRKTLWRATKSSTFWKFHLLKFGRETWGQYSLKQIETPRPLQTLILILGVTQIR